MISFKGKHFLEPIILIAICWYIAYALSYRDIEELLLERKLTVDGFTINSWVIEYAPQLAGSTLAGVKLHQMLRRGRCVNAANQSVFEQFYALAG